MSRPARLHAVLLAGGSGTRFWPLSRARRPKQLLSVSGGESLLKQAWRRARRLAPASRVWVVAPRALVSPLSRELPGLAQGKLIVEPVARDTAPAIALACAVVAEQDSPDRVVCVLPSDHVVEDVSGFERALLAAADEAARGSLVCLGVPPERPATGFGYIRCRHAPHGTDPVPVLRFVEKPDRARALRFLRSGRYLWNAGVFVWQAGRFLEELSRHAPRVLRAIEGHLAGDKDSFRRAPRISVDYAVLEKAAGVKVVPLRAGWDDLGSWEAMSRLVQSARGSSRSVLSLDSEASAVFRSGREKFLALLGVPGIVVVDTPDALLVMAKERAEEVKRVVEKLRELGRGDLL